MRTVSFKPLGEDLCNVHLFQSYCYQKSIFVKRGVQDAESASRTSSLEQKDMLQGLSILPSILSYPAHANSSRLAPGYTRPKEAWSLLGCGVTVE